MSTAAPVHLAYLSLSRLIHFGGIAVVLLVGVPIVLILFIDPLLFAGMPGHLAAEERWRTLASSTAFQHPNLLYLAAFWFLASACGRLAHGRMFENRTIRPVVFAGIALMAGAFASLVTRPLMLSGPVVVTDPDLTEYFGHLRSMYGNSPMQISALVIGTVGGMLVLMGFVMHRGAAAHAENEQMF